MHINNNSFKTYCMKDKKIALALAIQFCMLITNHSLKQILNIQITEVRQIISLTFMLITGVFYIRAIPIVLKRIGNIIIIAYLASIAIFLLSCLLFNENMKYIFEIAFYYFLMCLPNFLYYLAIKDKKIFLDMIVNTVYYQIILVVFFFVSIMLRRATFEYEYDMVYSYLSIVPIIILIYKVFNKFSFLDSMLILIGGAIVLVAGARGPIVCIVAFIFIYIISNSIIGKDKIKFVSILSVAFVIIILALLNFNILLNVINDILIKRNIYSRTIYTLLNIGEFDFTAGRSDIYKVCLEAIKNNPLLGLGVGGDRVVLDGTYPHNIVLEILMNFGVFFGSLFTIFILIITVKSIFNRNFVNRSLSIIFMGIGFMQLFMSGSYITSPNFWLYLSICFCSTFKTDHS